MFVPAPRPIEPYVPSYAKRLRDGVAGIVAEVSGDKENRDARGDGDDADGDREGNACSVMLVPTAVVVGKRKRAAAAASLSAISGSWTCCIFI